MRQCFCLFLCRFGPTFVQIFATLNGVYLNRHQLELNLEYAARGVSFANEKNIHLIAVDAPENSVAPIIFSLPLQLLAYHCALQKGTDVDKPRNLAKSVTVE